MNRYSADEIKEAWGYSPKIARRQAERAIPVIKDEISALKCELAVCEDVMTRDLDAALPSAPAAEDNDMKAYARGDEDESGGIGSQMQEPAKAEA